MALKTKKEKVFCCSVLLFACISHTTCFDGVWAVIFNGDERDALTGYDSSIENATVPGSKIESSCKAFIEKYAVVAAGFTKCSIQNARPLRYCEKCVRHYAMSQSVFKEIMTVRVFFLQSNIAGATKRPLACNCNH